MAVPTATPCVREDVGFLAQSRCEFHAPDPREAFLRAIRWLSPALTDISIRLDALAPCGSAAEPDPDRNASETGNCLGLAAPVRWDFFACSRAAIDDVKRSNPQVICPRDFPEPDIC